MKQVFITKEQFDRILAESVKIEGSTIKPNSTMKAVKDKTYKYLQGLAKQNDPNFQKTASNLGLNTDKFGDGKKKYNTNYDKNFGAVVDSGFNYKLAKDGGFEHLNVDPKISREIYDAAKEIKQYVHQNPMGATIDWEGLISAENGDYLMRMKDLIDRNGLSRLYDDNAPLPSNKGYGLTKDSDANFDYVGQDDSYMKKFAKGMSPMQGIQKFWTSRLSRYAEAKFGMKINMPNTMFGNGNGKLPDSTLIVNFTSSFRCPAWNECLVKHACYARAGQKRENNSFYADTNKNLMWQLTKEDPKMMELMMNMVKSYMFDYDSILKKGNKIFQQHGIKAKTGEDLMSLNFSEIDEEIAQLFTNNRNITEVRLNENGDFIGQWLVDAWNDFAGQISRFGITVSAYTCRHLNFEGIKNIVLNASNLAVKNATRYFIAITEAAYNSFDDTYDGMTQDGKINMKLQPLGNVNEMGEWTPNGNMYYKCPCGRDDMADGKVNCYQCNTCYIPNDINNGNPYYVFVKVHGSAKDELKERDGGKFRFGISQNYLQNMEAILNSKYSGRKLKNAQIALDNEQPINEDTELGSDSIQDDRAIQQIATNAVISTNEHFSQMGLYETVNRITENIIDKLRNGR